MLIPPTLEHPWCAPASVRREAETARLYARAWAEDYPCRICPLRERCAAQRLVCDQFAAYVEGKRWQDAARVPTRELYLKIMDD